MGFSSVIKALRNRPTKPPSPPSLLPAVPSVLIIPPHVLGPLQDLLPLIFSHCDTHTLHALCLTSHHFHTLATPILYSRVTFDCTHRPSYCPKVTRDHLEAFTGVIQAETPAWLWEYQHGPWLPRSEGNPQPCYYPSLPPHTPLSGWALSPPPFEHTTHLTIRCHTELCGVYLFYPLAFPAIRVVRLVIHEAAADLFTICNNDGRGPTFLQRLAPHTVVYRDLRDMVLITEEEACSSRSVGQVAVTSAKRLVVVIPAKPVKKGARGLKSHDMWRAREVYPFVEEVTIVLQACGGYMEAELWDGLVRKWGMIDARQGGFEWDRSWITETLGTFCAWWPTRVRVVGADGVARVDVQMPKERTEEVGIWIEKEVREAVATREVDKIWVEADREWASVEELASGREAYGAVEKGIAEKQASIEFVKMRKWLEEKDSWEDVLDLEEKILWTDSLAAKS
ncbi:hypothetical protein IAT38_005517 [Cryptococcus sp. DSM 104549]